MKRFKILVLLALLAGASAGCATATRRGDGLASIRSRSRAEVEAPPQHLVTTTRPDADPATAGHAGIFARPDGLSKFFPGLQKEAAETPKVAKAAARPSWLGRRLRGLGQGTPTSLTYSTAPKPGDRKPGPGEVSILPVALKIPVDRPRDREVTMTRAEAGPPAGETGNTEPLTPLEPANPESFSPADDPAPAKPADRPASEPTAPAASHEPATPEPASPPAEPASTFPEPTLEEPTLPGPTLPEPTLPEPTLPDPKSDTPPVSPEPAPLEPKPADPEPTPASEPAAGTPAPAPAEEAKPATPAPAPVPSVATPAPEAARTAEPTSDPRERPRLPLVRPQTVTTGAAPSAGPRKATPTESAAVAAPSTPSKSIPIAARAKVAGQGERPAAPVVAAKTKVQDRNVRAAKVQVEAARALGLPDPTLPASYYRSDAPPVQGGDAAVAATTTAPVDPAVAQVAGPCPHCGHDPHWRPSLQRLGRRVFGLGEFATPQP